MWGPTTRLYILRGFVPQQSSRQIYSSAPRQIQRQNHAQGIESKVAEFYERHRGRRIGKWIVPELIDLVKSTHESDQRLGLEEKLAITNKRLDALTIADTEISKKLEALAMMIEDMLTADARRDQHIATLNTEIATLTSKIATLADIVVSIAEPLVVKAALTTFNVASIIQAAAKDPTTFHSNLVFLHSSGLITRGILQQDQVPQTVEGCIKLASDLLLPPAIIKEPTRVLSNQQMLDVFKLIVREGSLKQIRDTSAHQQQLSTFCNLVRLRHESGPKVISSVMNAHWDRAEWLWLGLWGKASHTFSAHQQQYSEEDYDLTQLGLLSPIILNISEIS
ncbi:hypothetical protein MIND_00894000 [Mycena indigotica]|uniref:Uncharacterized protein n=1 Tax=Mycena indigotica TaxID=2126181 RepID=A0A8H6SJH5_9AGAR|nr:uncharacterized protein MIND_00894000 [Mycena indigotica]KAF7299442.1 hypothetical protein MIND_00894000 [Mycena indigotica]